MKKKKKDTVLYFIVFYCIILISIYDLFLNATNPKHPLDGIVVPKQP